MKKIFAREMQNLEAAGLLRTETAVVQTDNMEVHFGANKNFINYMGNDFLGWSSNAEVREAARQAFTSHYTGSTSSRNSIGTLDIVKTLEVKLASFFGLEQCIIFPSNYLANIGLFEPLTGKRDTIFIDEMCNPGLFDGIRLSSANVITYKHQDYEDLEYHLKCSKNSRYRIVVTEGVFNVDGSCAKLDEIQKLISDYDAISIIDDGLGIGMLGENGKGTFNHLKLTSKPTLMTGTFAQGLGYVSGGFVCGDNDIINWIRHTSRAYILSEPIPPVNAAIVLKTIEILEKDESVLNKLHSNSVYLKDKILENKWSLIQNDSPFISINVGSTLNAQKIVEHLFEKNILASALCYPNTPEGASLLRINISASHTHEQMDKLIKTISSALKLNK